MTAGELGAKMLMPSPPPSATRMAGFGIDVLE
jgi:hypothetical protein